MWAQRVNRSYLIPDTDDRVVLTSWSASREPLLRNVVRIDRDGRIVWRAELPGIVATDCFTSLVKDGDFFVAKTYSGWTVFLDANGSAKYSREAVMA